ncbi:MAG: sigma-54 dependent transcriptional regulator [Nitrospirota bacterium]
MAGAPSYLATPRAGVGATFTILLVEDQATDTELLLHAIEKADLKALEGEIEIVVRATAEGALKALTEQPVDLVLTDMVLPGMSGLDLISQLQEIDRNLPVLVVTRVNEVPSAVDAIRRGAYDYVLKPVNPTDLGMRLHRAIRISEIIRRNSAFERTMQQTTGAGSLVGTSDAFRNVLRLMHEAAQVRSTVLITGETGTGKGLIARAIHEQSQERDKPFQVIDCANLPEGIMESELFGHVRGAFTGAIADKPGLIELANGGTVFLDEIGELPSPLQAKLLRVLEESEVRRVGGTRVKRVDTRFVAATNQDLEEKVRTGAFRQDLYYRLAVISLHVPPLRDRAEDIAAIARLLVAQFGKEMGKPGCYLDSAAVADLAAYRWPGNVRELRNVIERAVILATEDAITGADIRALLPQGKKIAPSQVFLSYTTLPYTEAKNRVVADFGKTYVKEKLAKHGSNVTRAAEDSGIPRQHFALLMKRYLDHEPSGGS